MKKWSFSTVESILTNEKNMGDAILQKTYCTDFLSKIYVVNTGEEVPRYYVRNSHPAIVSAEVFNLTQVEYRRRKALKGSTVATSASLAGLYAQIAAVFSAARYGTAMIHIVG